MPRAAVLTAPRTLVLEERPPLHPGRGEVLIEVERAGICGTDLALYAGDYAVPLPLVPGHEFTGRVRETGPGVDTAWRDRRVVAEINNTCLAYQDSRPCRACRQGLPSHCQRRTVTGIIQKDGAFAEEVCVPAGVLHAVPESCPASVAVLCEPLAAALQTFAPEPADPPETVVVLGPGRLGILIVFLAGQRGLNCLAVSRSESKRRRALAFGAREALPPEEARRWVDEQTEGLGADWVIDATGHPDGITQAMSLVRPRGTISVKTTCGLPARGLDMTRLVVNEITLQGTRCGPFAPALDLLTRHHANLRTLISSERPLEEAPQAMEAAFQEDKVILTLGGT